MRRSGRGAAAAAGMALAMVWAASASADVVGPPPDDCPDGTTARSCHGGTYCAPDGCSSDAQCEAGEKCTVVQACVGGIVCMRRLPPQANPEDYQRDTVEGLCPEGTACESGRCQPVSLCVRTDASAGGGPGEGSGAGGGAGPGGGDDDDGGCGCHATAPRSAPGAGWVLVVAALGIAGRRLSLR